MRARYQSREQANPFKAASHPPGVGPDTKMAMDDAFSGRSEWALGAIGSLFGVGQVFIGYPILSELAQRPEYRRIVETIATEMTRKWIEIQATGKDEDKSDKIAKINAEMDRLQVRSVFREAAEHDGYFGRSHIYLDFGTSDDLEEMKTPIGDGQNEISVAKVSKGSLERLKCVEPVWCYPASYNTNDPLKPDWYKPSHWFVLAKQTHASRLLTFVGREVPDLLKPAYSFGGLSLSQMVRPYVDNWLRTRQSVSDLIHSFSVMGLKTNLNEVITGGGAEQFYRRLQIFNDSRDNSGVMALDKEGEDLFNVATPLGTLDHLQAQSQEHIASASGLPLVKFTGITPSGLNASSDGEIRSFEDWVASYQETLYRPNLTRVLHFVQLSLFGEVDPEITFVFKPLRALDEKELAEVRKIEAETDAALIDAGIIKPEESRTRIAADPDTPYAALIVEDAPGISEVEKADVAAKVCAAIIEAFEAGLIDKPGALRELKASGVFPHITDEMINEAELDPPQPLKEGLPEVPEPDANVQAEAS